MAPDGRVAMVVAAAAAGVVAGGEAEAVAVAVNVAAGDVSPVSARYPCCNKRP